MARGIVGLFGMLAWMFSGAQDDNEVIGVSSDDNPTKYLLSKAQRNNLSAENDEETMSEMSKNGINHKILYATSLTSRNGEEAPKIYNYPHPVYKTFYMSGVDEDEVDLAIYDMDGKCIPTKFVNKFEVAFLPKGTYILCINEYFVKFLKL